MKQVPKNAEEPLENRDELNKIFDIITSIEGNFDGIYEQFSQDEAAKKMKKKEREAYLRNVAADQFPTLIKELQGLNLAFEGIEVWMNDVRDHLQEQEDILDEIEQLKDEIEDKKRELD